MLIGLNVCLGSFLRAKRLLCALTPDMAVKMLVMILSKTKKVGTSFLTFYNLFKFPCTRTLINGKRIAHLLFYQRLLLIHFTPKFLARSLNVTWTIFSARVANYWFPLDWNLLPDSFPGGQEQVA